jgi:hypothetical protein
MIELATTGDAPGSFPYRAYWGANSIAAGTDGTPSRQRIGNLPALGQWTRLEIPAKLLDLEGRRLNGANFILFDGVCSWDQMGRFPNRQRATSLISIPSLAILGPTTRTIQPGAKFRPQANYDDAQTIATRPTWSKVSGGGSVSSDGEVTVQTNPGTMIVRALGPGNQNADITINVPAIITPNFNFAAPLEQIDWDTNISGASWSSSPAGINSSTGVITFPNTPGAKVRIQATDGSFTATRDILIFEKFPISRFATPMDGERRKKVLNSEAEDGTDVSRAKDKDGAARDSYPIQIKLLTLAELNSIRDFWDHHHPGKRFILENTPLGIRQLVKFDSDLNWQAYAGRFNVAFRVKEAAPQ